MQYVIRILLFVFVLFVLPVFIDEAGAADISDRLSLGGILVGAVHCQSVSGSGAVDDTCEGALPLQPEISFRPTRRDELFVKVGLAAGNGLNRVSPFRISNWAVDMSEDLVDINGSGRNHLLTAWYRHDFNLAPGSRLGVMAGIMDATEYLDNNAYANDPYTQFMNAALTFGPNTFVPSYDLGVVVDWDIEDWSIHAVVMDVSQNIDDNEYLFYGLQLGYRLKTVLGEGNYRLLLDATSNDFLDASGTRNTQHLFAILSLDQALGDTFGVFMRLGWQDDSPMIDYQAIYSGGLDVRGRGWGRPADNIGLGFAYLEGGNQALDHTQIAEAYYRFVFSRLVSVSADIQYMRDSLKQGANIDGYIYSIRAALEF